MIPLALFALGACLPIEGSRNHIRAGDLARADAAWSTVAPDVPVALAPSPGVQRVIRIPEMRALAARWNVISDSAREVCFIRPVAPITPERMLEAMHRELPDARIEIVEASRIPAPEGTIEFPRGGLRAGYWHGYVTYGAGRRFAIWACVKVTVALKRAVASVDLKPGEPIAPSQVRFEMQDVSWDARPLSLLESRDSIVGWVPRRSIAAGVAIEKQWLEPPKLIRKGDSVKVEVVAGAATLHLDGIAESAGALGDWIPVRNPDSKRTFRARVEAEGRVSVKGVR